MKRLIFFFFVLLPMMVAAQNDIKLYDELCEPLQAVFCDYVKEGEVKYISTPDGQYVGHLIDNVIYGWGRFLADNGTQVYGQYSRGKLMFGIIMNGTTARVGGDVNYVEYDLSTGRALRVHTIEGDAEYSVEQLALYTFNKVTYANGDAYFGELYDGRRHGYGIYYWSNGDFWYGRYINGYRQGYGALFKVNRKIFCGRWFGDKKME